MAIFLWDEFDVQAREHNLDLRGGYFHFISDFHSYQLVYGCDKKDRLQANGLVPTRNDTRPGVQISS